MADCKYCSFPAGIFRHQHSACAEAHATGGERLSALAAQASLDPELQVRFPEEAQKIAAECFLTPPQRSGAVIAGIGAALAHALEDRILSEDEEDRIATFIACCGFQDAVRAAGVDRKIAMAGALREVMEGKIPRRVRYDDDLPFNMHPDEALVWQFPSAIYAEEKIVRSYVGGSSGMSFRIAKGVYYRVGAFKGNPVQTTSLQAVDDGKLYVTSAGIYFKGISKFFRMRFREIVGWQGYEDGIGIWKSTANAKQKVFTVGKDEGWFAYNVIRNLAELDSQPAKPGAVKGFRLQED